MLLSGADIIVETLIEQGCDTVFGYPGGQILNVYDSLYTHQEQINHILTAHEQGAAHAADGYARTTGKVGVVISTSGPGATNLVTGIATAYLDSVPMIAICGNVPTTQIGSDSFQEIDITGITLPITKHNYFVGSVDKLADTIREAFALAKSGRPGPVLIDVPKDVQIAKCEFTPTSPAEAEPLHPAKEKRVEDGLGRILSHSLSHATRKLVADPLDEGLEIIVGIQVWVEVGEGSYSNLGGLHLLGRQDRAFGRLHLHRLLRP